jgi:F-type H+-transporting ATPase subunit delta
VASRAAKRYADAVFCLARDKGTLDAWQGDLALLASIVEDGRIATYLTNPSVSAESKIAAVESAISAWNVQPETHKLARILIERDRVRLVPEIRELFDEQVRTEHGIVAAYVTTAESLNDAERDLVREKLEELTGKQVQMDIQVDPDLIGGIIIRVGDQVIDGSVRNKLEKLRSRLVAGRH